MQNRTTVTVTLANKGCWLVYIETYRPITAVKTVTLNFLKINYSLIDKCTLVHLTDTIN